MVKQVAEWAYTVGVGFQRVKSLLRLLDVVISGAETLHPLGDHQSAA